LRRLKKYRTHARTAWLVSGYLVTAPAFCWHEVCRWILVKRAFLLIVVLAIGLTAFFCKKSGWLSREPVPPHLEYNYDYDKKEVFDDDANSDLAEMDNNIKELSQKAAIASDGVKTEAQAKIQKLADERAALGKKLDALKDADKSNWNTLKADFQKSEYDMKTSLQETWQWFAGKTPS
jgi:hypothetical protein